ncbi:MAG: DUF1173 family protein [Alphaproteobacteria bacterium]|nr:MAG: DUF1173 family protein [Alphaproteobacteria bacterium]
MSSHWVEQPQAPVYEIAGRQYDIRSPHFAAAIARAHANQQRPRCACRPEGIETYVARLNDGYVVKRMPDTGNQHAASCPHFEPPADASGLRPLLGTAIREDPATGLTTLRLDFSMSRSTRRQAPLPSAQTASSTARSDQRLTLRNLLLYLWEQAGLTRWHPGFAGKRPWATVRHRLLRAAGDKLIGGRPLVDRLYIPEPFNVEKRDAIARRRSAAWASITSGTAGSGQLLLLIGELKQIAPARCNFKAVVKQVPDLVFIIEERLHRQITRRLQPALTMWSSANDIRMMMVGTFALGASDVPTLVEVMLVPTTLDWIPVENAPEHELVTQLIYQGKSFLKCVRYDANASSIDSPIVLPLP